MKYRLVMLALLCSCHTFSWGSTQTGTVTDILARTDGLHWIYVTGSRSAKPGCATVDYWMIKDENSAYGKSQFSLLLSAYLSGKQVIIGGLDACTRWTDGEDIGTVHLRNP